MENETAQIKTDNGKTLEQRIKAKKKKNLEKMHSKDTLPGLKTQKKKPNETKNNNEKKKRKEKNKERTPRSNAVFRVPRIRARLSLVVILCNKD